MRCLSISNRRQSGLRLFEIGNVFPVPDAGRVAAAMEHADPQLTVVDEREVAGLLLAGPETTRRAPRYRGRPSQRRSASSTSSTRSAGGSRRGTTGC